MRTSASYRVTISIVVILVAAVILSGSARDVRGQSATVPQFSHIFLIVEENAESSRVLGNSARYVNQIAPSASIATEYYAITHPSLPNYLAMMAGDTFGISSDCLDCFVDQPNLADQIEASGRQWRVYADSLPAPCFVGSAGPYSQTHNPLIYFDSIRTQPRRCASGIVPFTQFQLDLAAHQLPDFAFIIPDLCHDGHDCSWQIEDEWTAGVMPLILGSPEFQTGGAVFITWDEGATSAACCSGLAQGGKVALAVVSPLARGGYKTEAVASHYSLLRTIEDAWGLPPLGHAADFSAMTDMFDIPSQ